MGGISSSSSTASVLGLVLFASLLSLILLPPSAEGLKCVYCFWIFCHNDYGHRNLVRPEGMTDDEFDAVKEPKRCSNFDIAKGNPKAEIRCEILSTLFDKDTKKNKAFEDYQKVEYWVCKAVKNHEGDSHCVDRLGEKIPKSWAEDIACVNGTRDYDNVCYCKRDLCNADYGKLEGSPGKVGQEEGY